MTEMQTPRPAKPRALKWVLGVSLALNFVFIGIFIGGALRYAGNDRGEDNRGGARVQNFGAPFVRALPRADQRRLHGMLRAEGGGLPSRAERRVLHQQLIEAMRAPGFDPSQIEQLFEAQNDAAKRVMGKAQSAWLDIVRDMSDAERAEVADRLEERLKRRRPRDRKRP